MKYSDLVVEWLRDLGYTHCFFVAGGNIMHLLDAVRTKMTCVAFVHEVAAAIAVETFNDARDDDGPRAFALVTAGPGLTNAITAFAGAWLESRELLVLGGQVKSSDLARGEIRQRGIQEIDGVAIVRSVSKQALRIESPIPQEKFGDLVRLGRSGRKGPIFMEFCLDAQGAPVDPVRLNASSRAFEQDEHWTVLEERGRSAASELARRICDAARPVLLIGGGVSRTTATAVRATLESSDIVVMTTWNGADRYDGRADNYFGRPNQWGQRCANVLVQQADLVVALGTRLGIQQTGFNWQEFAPDAFVAVAEIDGAELEKGHPRIDMPINGDANALLTALVDEQLGDHVEWLDFARHARERLPLEDPQNLAAPGYLDPYRFCRELAAVTTPADLVTPCSSGGAYTTMMQSYRQKFGQIIVSDKGLASMGYGLSAAIGVSLARPGRRNILVEGDGGFSQNLQELATVTVNRLNLKIFVFSNEGYASIRMTQRNYFGGEYMGCDVRTGLGFPDWEKLFSAYGIPALRIDGTLGLAAPEFVEPFAGDGPAAFIVMLDPEQTFYPKISSRVTASGNMESAPLHLMSPDLPEDIARAVFRYMPEAIAATPKAGV